MLLSIIVSVVSTLEIVQDYNYHVGLGQASLISLYCTYLVLSAVVMAPDHLNCNPISQNRNTQKLSGTLGTFFAFLTIAFTTARTASSDLFSSPSNSMAAQGDNHTLEDASSQLIPRDLVHESAIQDIIKKNRLSDDALPTVTSTNDHTNTWAKQGTARTIYQLLFFHVIFLLSVCWIAYWLSMHIDERHNNLKSAGRTYWASWIKVLSSELCYSLYIWSLYIPIFKQ